MSDQALTAKEAAQRLGIEVSTLYGWLAQSNSGKFFLQGQPFTIEYRQTGPRGQGRIRIETTEVERLQQAMRARPRVPRQRRRPLAHRRYPGITVPLGRPND